MNSTPRPAPTPTRAHSATARRPGTGTVAERDEAEEFLRQFHTEHPEQPVPLARRLRQVRAAIDAAGTYRHTPGELAFGARVAWRNSRRCIGRLYWNSLRVLDRREAKTPGEIHRYLCDHLRQATNRGRIRPVISVFAPDAPGRPGPRIWNDQLIRYAGQRRGDGTVEGDAGYVDFTERVRGLGWQGPDGPFDILPLVVDTADEKPQLFELPHDLVMEVAITHPDCPRIAELDLRWHAVPAISNMRLRVGGIDYPLAPFNGWYMGTEIGARNLVDEGRYNLLPAVAACLGLDTSREGTLWRDRALVELNVAVLHSFRAAGARMSDHHTESRRFLAHLAREEREGRTVPADWTWIVPPLSGGITPVFHRSYDDADQRPNFYPPAPDPGPGACPYPH
ncbi:nitric oxide synthase oxygenase [Streptomyces sp. CJ_13]|uniref:nitric oxide synthase oxygenase n=1 Tax=Streptomyces TaxID=1883 RepID=UPI000F3A98BB|nr:MULTISPECIES: nitric oxide synthase oxygenase [unclassified Streptomyces]AYV26034.1 Nitric oxide synthase oxygenase [Streptomyces sp. ADI95-16]MBT1185476.1 nitric oxide synthase oxygenase [Streptomyces sp. CJ_13]